MKGFGRAKAVAVALRISMALSIVWTVVTLAKILSSAMKVDLAEFNKYADVSLTQPLHTWQIVCAGVLLLVWVTPLFSCFWKLHRLLGQLDSSDYFALAVERMIRSIGWTLIVFWCVDYAISTFGPVMLTVYEPGGPKFDPDFPFNAGLIFVVLGTILISLAKVLAEGRRLDEEAKLIV